MTTRLDPLEYLERSDKWYLGGGKGLVYAPPFPRYLGTLGFWDEAHFADVKLERLYAVLLLDEDARPLTLSRESRRWTPDALTQIYAGSDGLRIREDKVVSSRDVLGLRLRIHNDGRRPRTLHAILWSLQNSCCDAGVFDVARSGDYLNLTLAFAGQQDGAEAPAEVFGWGSSPGTSPAGVHRLFIALGSDAPLRSFTVGQAERCSGEPLWEVSVVPEALREGSFDNQIHAPSGPNARPGVQIHCCMQYSLEVLPGESRLIQFGAAVSLSHERALHNLEQDLRGDVAAASRASWQSAFRGVPYFECSDEYLQKYYWYRWYGLRLLTVDLSQEDGHGLPYPCVFEGIGGFRSHISYSAQCHLLEAGWKRDPALAYGCIEGMLAAQENSGFIPGHLYLWRQDRGFYHANWGANALQVARITGDVGFVERVYPGLCRYADYFERERDREDMGLFDVVDQGETGQEYSSRYLFVDERADEWGRFQLKGVDATVYVYMTLRALAEMARLLGKEPEAEVWDRKADRVRDAVRRLMWDPDRHFFFDVDPRTGRRSPYKAAVGFYPFLCDIATGEHLPAIREHLLNPAEFATPWPVPTSSLDDPYFSAEGEWKGIRMSCPWNGRVWPMTNSHICEALARASLTLDPSLRPVAVDFIQRFIRMMFWFGDVERPNCFEHYNPFTGAPSAYRGIDDYQHSWVVDLLVKYLIGVQPPVDSILVLDPLPFDVDRFRMEGLHLRGHNVNVVWDAASGYVVSIDGVERARSPQRTRLEIPF